MEERVRLVSSRLRSLRMDSCVVGDEERLLDTFMCDDINAFVDALNDEEVDVNHNFADHEMNTLLEMAITSRRLKFVKVLLRHPKIDVNKLNVAKKRAVLHLLAEQLDVDLMHLILVSVEAGVVDLDVRQENGWTPLHIVASRSAAKFVTDANEKLRMQQRALDCADLLLSNGCRVDVLSNLGATPLFLAATKGSEAMVCLLLRRGASVSIEVDDMPLKDIIEDNWPKVYDNFHLEKRDKKSGILNEEALFQCLYEERFNSGQFEHLYNEMISRSDTSIDVNYSDGSYTMLQYACDQGLDHLVPFLISKGADVNGCGPNCNSPPLLLAAHHGYYKVIRGLLNAGGVDLTASDLARKETALHKAIRSESRSHVNFDQRNYDRSIRLLIEAMNKMGSGSAINKTDIMSNTPLHLAVKTNNTSAIRQLLHAGADVSARNCYGQAAIDKIPVGVMEQFLDECLKAEQTPANEDFRLVFKYKFLGKNGSKLYNNRSNEVDAVNNDDDDDGDEGVLEAWDAEEADQSGMRMRTRLGKSKKQLPEAEQLWALAQSPVHRRLLVHPVISSFLCLKWRTIRPLYYVNLLFYLVFVMASTLAILLGHTNLDDEGNDSDSSKGNVSVSLTTTWMRVMLILLIVREAFQALVSFRRYFFDFETMMELLMVVSLVFLFFFTPASSSTRRLLAGVGLLLVWVELVLLLGKHPRLSTYWAMFKTVSINFCLFLTWYAILIVAFALSFYVLLSRNNKDEDGNKDEEEENAYFSSPSRSLLKTFVMSLTGEIEFEGIDFSQSMIASTLVFLLYVFFILLVLVNLLNGLAVSDISEIRAKAEVLAHVSQVELISYTESVMLGDPFQFLSNWPRLKALRKLPSGNCLAKLYRWSVVQWMLRTLFGSTLLFVDRLRSKEAVFYPNKSNLEAHDMNLEKKLKRRRGIEHRLLLDQHIMERATDLALQRREQGVVEAKLEKIERSLLLIAKQQNHIISENNEMKKKLRM